MVYNCCLCTFHDWSCHLYLYFFQYIDGSTSTTSFSFKCLFIYLLLYFILIHFHYTFCFRHYLSRISFTEDFSPTRSFRVSYPDRPSSRKILSLGDDVTRISSLFMQHNLVFLPGTPTSNHPSSPLTTLSSDLSVFTNLVKHAVLILQPKLRFSLLLLYCLTTLDTPSTSVSFWFSPSSLWTNYTRSTLPPSNLMFSSSTPLPLVT